MGEALHPQDEAARREWVETRRHALRHGQEQRVLQEIAALASEGGEAGKAIRREQNYFVGHDAADELRRAGPERLTDRQRRGGIGVSQPAMPTQTARPGQFWTSAGLRHLDALEEVRDNGHLGELWLIA